MYKITFITGALLVLLMQGCTQPQKQFDAQNKQKIQAVIWDGVPYRTYGYVQEADKNQVKPMSLDKVLLGLNTSKMKHLRKYLNHTVDSFSKSASVAQVYHGLDMGIFTLLSHKVDDIIVTYVDDKLAHVYVSLKKQKKKKTLSEKAIKQEMYVANFMQDVPLGDIQDMLNKKFGQAFYYGSAEANSDSNEVWTWGMHKDFYYKVVVNQEGKYAYVSIKSKVFMKKLSEEIIDVKKWQRKQDGVVESMVTVHKKDKK